MALGFGYLHDSRFPLKAFEKWGWEFCTLAVRVQTDRRTVLPNLLSPCFVKAMQSINIFTCQRGGVSIKQLGRDEKRSVNPLVHVHPSGMWQYSKNSRTFFRGRYICTCPTASTLSVGFAKTRPWPSWGAITNGFEALYQRLYSDSKRHTGNLKKWPWAVFPVIRVQMPTFMPNFIVIGL